MTFEATFRAAEVEQALQGMKDSSASGEAAKAGLRAVVLGMGFPAGRLVHVHARTSGRIVALLVRAVDRPEDAC